MTIFRFNGDFEDELSVLPRPHLRGDRMEQLCQDLAPLMLWLGQPGDRVIAGPLPARPTPAYHLWPPPGTQSVSESSLFPGAPAYLPWGITPLTLEEGAGIDPGGSHPDPLTVKRVQSRDFGSEIEACLGICLPNTFIIPSMDRLDHALNGRSGTMVIKHPFGVAGRNRRFIDPPPATMSPATRAWCQASLASAGHLLLEPWVERIRDFGLQIWLPEVGPPVLLGALEFLTDPRGGYLGHVLGGSPPPPELSRIGIEVAHRVRAAGYFGPMGIDAFSYRDESGSERFRPLVEINARCTMGMVALGIQKRLQPDRLSVWLHGSGSPGQPFGADHWVLRSLQAQGFCPEPDSRILWTSGSLPAPSRTRRISCVALHWRDERWTQTRFDDRKG